MAFTKYLRSAVGFIIAVLLSLSGSRAAAAEGEDALANAPAVAANRYYFNNAYFEGWDKSEGESRGGNAGSSPRALVVAVPRAIIEALFPDKPLTAGIKKTSSPRRVFALRVAERGREFLANREYDKALRNLETALGVESLPYFYYYMAQAHYSLEQYDLSSKFVEVAETLLSGEPRWLAKVRELRKRVSQANSLHLVD